MESMKRIDILKGIEQILVQKAYETGHISHRTDGDWQKQADGSWTPYAEQSTQNSSNNKEPNTIEELQNAINFAHDAIAEYKKQGQPVPKQVYERGIELQEKLNKLKAQPQENTEYGEITEEDLQESSNSIDVREIEKSAYRDMRSTPATKNMGF